MNYSGLIRQFWKYNGEEPLGAVAVAIYLFLLEIWKENDENDFKLSDTEICERLKITRPTIISSRQKLRNLGMIQYQSKSGLPGHYRIIMEYSPVLPSFEKSETDKGDLTTKRSQKSIAERGKNSIKPKTKTGITKNQDLFSDNLTEVPVIVPSSLSGKIPSRDDFMEYAKTLENYIPELDNLIKAKYDSWLENGWKNGYDKPITNWKSSLKNTIPFLQIALQPNSAVSSKITLQTINRPKSTYDE